MSDNPRFHILVQGQSHIVIDFESLVGELSTDQLLCLNGEIAARMLMNANAATTGENNGLENPEKDC